MSIGTRRDSKIPQTPGPSDYSPDKANNITKSISKKADFSRSSPRKSLVVDPSGGPGTYDHTSAFDERVNGMTIGQR